MSNYLSSTRRGNGSSSSSSRNTRGDDTNDYLPASTTNWSILGNYSGSDNHIKFYHALNHNYRNYGDRDGGYVGVLRCLYTSHYMSHRDRVRGPVVGTCTWVIDHPKYKEWLGKTTPSILWLSADPGCGKSVIATFLVDHLRAHTSATICYFFFKDDNDEQRSAEFALCALLHQLFIQKESPSKYAEKIFSARGKRLTEEVDTLWDILVKAVAEEGYGEVICVVDALDECEEVTQGQLIGHFASLSNSDTPLKFVVTSRPYHQIERTLGLDPTTIRLRGEDEVNAIAADVTRVIGESVKDLESFWCQPSGLGYLRDALESSADGTFIWVSLVIDILNNSVDDSQEGFTNIISTAPRDLAEFYTKILDKSTNPDQARRILQIVVAAARPLTLLEVNIAFTIGRKHLSIIDLQSDLDPTFERTVKELCGLFVRIINSKVYLAHRTAREFLMKGTLLGQGNWQYTLCPVDSNLFLADICISYLTLGDFESDPFVVDTSSSETWEGVHNYTEKYPFLDYAASHWATHFRDSQDRQMDLFELTRQICKAGSNRFLTWLNVYWEKSNQYHPFPNDFTHLMMASWLGQRAVVEKLLEEGEDIDAQSKVYGTALNVAALRRDKDITGILLRRNTKPYLHGKECNISHPRKSELGDSVGSKDATSRGGLAPRGVLQARKEEARVTLERLMTLRALRRAEDDVIEFLKVNDTILFLVATVGAGYPLTILVAVLPGGYFRFAYLAQPGCDLIVLESKSGDRQP